MRFHYFALLGVFSGAAVASSACGGNKVVQGTGTTTGSGASGVGGSTVGAGGMAGASSASSSASSTASSSSSSGAKDAGMDVDNGMISTNYPAPHPAPPQVVFTGGPVLSMPKLIPVFFANQDPTLQPQIIDFVNKIGATPYWTATTGEYGVGAAVAGTPVVLTEMAPSSIDDSGIQSWLAAKLNANDAMWPAADDNTVYILHYPPGTTITQGNSSSCNSFGGYHTSITLDGAHNNLDVAYAVVPQCPGGGGMSVLETLTSAESHELVEAVTDPYPQTNSPGPAYGQVDSAHAYWELALGGGETGDMCAQFPGVFTTFPGLAYMVQRTWSNAAAVSGHDPCVPQPTGEVYFNSAPVLPDSIMFPGFGTMKGIKIPVGQTKTIELDLFSDAATTGPWKVSVKDYISLVMGGAPTMTFALDKTSGENGQKLHLTITVTKMSQFGAGVFLVESSLGPRTNLWLGLVGNN